MNQWSEPVRVLETPRAMLVRVPLGPERTSEFRVMAREDTLLIAGEGRVESIRLPRPAAARGLTARQDGEALYVRIPLESAVRPSWTQERGTVWLAAPHAPRFLSSEREVAERAVANARLLETRGSLGN